MALWGTTDQNSDEPTWLNSTDKGNVKGADDSEVQSGSNNIGHSGWVLPAGGNDNPNAQLECIATVTNMTGDQAGDSI